MSLSFLFFFNKYEMTNIDSIVHQTCLELWYAKELICLFKHEYKCIEHLNV